MENATKALLLSAAVLIAILILNIATRLFSTASGVTRTYDKEADISAARDYNAHFTVYYGAPKEDGTVQQQATIHDVVTVANFIINTNKTNQEDPYDKNESGHVRIDLEGATNGAQYKIDNLELYPKCYNLLIEKCYYQSPSSPNVNAIIHYEIKVISQDNSARIDHIVFKADSAGTTGSGDNVIFDIKQHLNDYKAI